MYQRYADLLPDSPERTRAAAAARSIGTLFGQFDLEHAATALAPAVDLLDHRPAGWVATRSGRDRARPRPVVALSREFRQHDWDALRQCLADDLVFFDHRALGLGTFDRDRWIESLRIWADLAPDLDTEWVRILAWNRQGRVAVVRAFGTMRDGGRFESVFIVVVLADGSRIRCNEVFGVGDAGQALARFEELCRPLAHSPTE